MSWWDPTGEVEAADDRLLEALDRLVEAAGELCTPIGGAFEPPRVQDCNPLVEELELAFRSIAHPLRPPAHTPAEQLAGHCVRIQDAAAVLAVIMDGLGPDRLSIPRTGLAIQIGAPQIPGAGDGAASLEPTGVIQLRPLDDARRRFRAAFASAWGAAGVAQGSWPEIRSAAAQKRLPLTVELYAECLSSWINAGAAGEAPLLFLGRGLLLELFKHEAGPSTASLRQHASLALLLRAIPFPEMPDPDLDGQQRASLIYWMR